MSLFNQQKQLLFDYSIGLTSEKETVQALELISSNAEAAEIYSKLKAAFAPLDSLRTEPCPDDLADSTVLRLNNAARSSQLRLQQLLAAEQTRSAPVGSRLWLSLGKRLATAAVFVIVGSVLITTWKVVSNYARQKGWQQQCQMQLSQIFDGIRQYSSDHDGKLPAVATSTGAPWWKVGYQGKENYSNTRRLWLLVKGNYVKPSDFVCPGSRLGQVLQFGPLKMKIYNDFPGRKYVNYSLRVRYNKSASSAPAGQRVLMADLNPLFEKLPSNFSSPLNIQLKGKLLTLNSINHNRRGQNVLFSDGSVKFKKTRRVGIGADDIFTLQNIATYQGIEVPTCETDAFLAP